MPNHDVRYPDRVSEFEIQAELLHRLRFLFLEIGAEDALSVRGEVPVRCTRGRLIRLDLVVFLNQSAVLAVEVKCKGGSPNAQVEDYSELLAIPVIACVGPRGVERVMEYVRREISHGGSPTGMREEERWRGLKLFPEDSLNSELTGRSRLIDSILIDV